MSMEYISISILSLNNILDWYRIKENLQNITFS